MLFILYFKSKHEYKGEVIALSVVFDVSYNNLS